MTVANDRPHFLLVGHEGSLNRGCEALVRTTVELLREEYPGSHVTVASKHPENDVPLLDLDDISIIPGVCRAPGLYGEGHVDGDSRESFPRRLGSLASRLAKALLPHGLVSLRARQARPPECPRPSSEEGFRQVRHLKPTMLSATAVISIGGDLFGEDWGPPVYAFETVEYAQFLGLKTVVLGASVGPFETAWVRERARVMFQKCNLVTVRDEPSHEYLSSLGISGNLAKVADGAFLMSPRPSERSRVHLSSPATCLVGFNGSSFAYHFLGPSKGQQVLCSLVRFLRGLIDEHDCGLALVPHDAYPPSQECDFLFEIMQALDRPGRVYLPPIGLDARETKALIGQCDLFVGMRFHPTIAALSQSIPTLGLGYSPKFVGLHQEVYGHTRLLVPYADTSFDTLMTKFQDLRKGREEIRRHLDSRIPELQALARRNSRLVRGVIG